MRANQLKTHRVGFMLWDKDLGKFATIDEVKSFCELEENIYGTKHELRLQCFGRYRVLAYTGINDKNNRPIYEGHIIKASFEIAGHKCVTVGVVGFERSEFVLINADGTVMPLSVFEPRELKIIGNIFENPELLEEK